MQLAQPRARAAAAVTGACSHQPTAPCDTARARVRAFAYARHRTCACRRCCGRRRLTAAESLGVRVVAVTSPSSRRRRGVVASPAGIAGLESSARIRARLPVLRAEGTARSPVEGRREEGKAMAPSARTRATAHRGDGSATHLSNLVDAHPLSSSTPAQALSVAHLRVQQRSQQGVRG